MKNTKNKILLLILFSGQILFSCTEDSDLINPVEDRDKFLGTWNVTENCSKTAYEVEIVPDPSNSSQVLITNFWLIGFNEKPPYAIVAGNSITIPSQTIGNDESHTVKGSGTLDKEIISWEYSVNDEADLHTCSTVYERK